MTESDRDLPITWDTTSAPSAFDPADWFDYCERITGRPRPTLPALAIQTLIRSQFDYVVEAFGAHADDFTLADHPFAIFRYQDHEIAIGYSAKGSYAAGGLDEMIALGATTIILLGGAATLVHDIAVDDLLVVTKALRDDGISLHYQPPTRYSHPSARVTACLTEAAEGHDARVHSGPIWTTTAHFRQALPRLQAFRAEGCRAVNNETAQAFSVGWLRGVEVASLLNIGDTLADDRFLVPMGHAKLYQVDDARIQLDIALDALVLAGDG
jgi:nucleoside phosphorylase